ncbi:MAG: polysaccharide deacetylase family protein [Flavobacteriaceae bacterium]|nr:polysaccharide deacetylase family protein [Flavobacteriaceae bacterium]
MSLYLVKTPNFIKSLFKDLVWSFTISEKKLYLTFDDGPTPEITPFILQQLKQFNAKATFFCVGENVEKYPEIFQQIISEGHSVGNHTNNHLNGWKTNTIDYLNNIEIAQIEIQKHLVSETKLFRPPYGKIKLSQIKKLQKKGFEIVMWNVLSGDFDSSISKEKVYQNIIKNTENGSIIVLHDHQKAIKNVKFALPLLIKYYQSLGFTFKPIG